MAITDVGFAPENENSEEMKMLIFNGNAFEIDANDQKVKKWNEGYGVLLCSISERLYVNIPILFILSAVGREDSKLIMLQDSI